MQLEDVSGVRAAIITNLQKENSNLKNELDLVRAMADRNEQKSRASCLLLHGVPEEENEDTDNVALDIIKNQIGVDISISDIERSHRVGSKKAKQTRKSKHRPLIMGFASMRKRMEVFASKKKLKSKEILLTESLTKFRYELLKKAKMKFGVKNKWTSEGRIHARVENEIILISTESDVE